MNHLCLTVQHGSMPSPRCRGPGSAGPRASHNPSQRQASGVGAHSRVVTTGRQPQLRCRPRAPLAWWRATCIRSSVGPGRIRDEDFMDTQKFSKTKPDARARASRHLRAAYFAVEERGLLRGVPAARSEAESVAGSQPDNQCLNQRAVQRSPRNRTRYQPITSPDPNRGSFTK